MSGHDGLAPSSEATAAPAMGGGEQSVVADYTESAVPASARRFPAQQGSATPTSGSPPCRRG